MHIKYFFLLVALSIMVNDAPAALLASDAVYQIAAPEIKKIFGDDRQDTFVNDGLLREAILESIGIPDEPPRALPGGVTMMSGCRPQSCNEKGAVIVDGSSKQLRAAALLHFHCRETLLADLNSTQLPPSTCDTEATLEIFVIRHNRILASLQQELSYVSALEA